METVRLRLLFRNKQLLTESLAKEGLNRSWILLKPNLSSISDLSSYILTVFHLHDACPHGLTLSMDGFVLPAFESVSILKDKDIVRVKKRKSETIDILKVNNGSNLIEAEEFKERLPIDKGVKLLADKEFENESVGQETESDEIEFKATLAVENAPVIKKVSKKRKASKILQTSRRKKKKSSPKKEFLSITADVQHTDEEHNESNHLKFDLPEKVIVSKNNSSSSSSESGTSNTSEIDGRSNNISKSTASAERFDQLDTGRRNVELSISAGEAKQKPSRSSRRKKARRQWNREKRQQQLVETSTHPGPSEHDDTDMEDDIVPVVIRPGHIRFEPVGKVSTEQAGQQNSFPMVQETSHWNGITNKKKGQKWGREKTSTWKKNYYNDFVAEPLQLSTNEAEPPVLGPLDFDNLRPCTSVPQEGDLVAYRLIELSSTWTPELSSFRVGKVSWYDSEANKIMLIPVPEYPLPCKKEIDEDSAVKLDTFPYGEDGSLKIDFTSLINLRIVKQGNLVSSKAVIGNGTIPKQGAESSFKVTVNNSDNNDIVKDNGKVNAWDEINKALNAKKAQLSKNHGWNQEESSGKRSWSSRTLRGSALGPTMALLRSQNEL